MTGNIERLRGQIADLIDGYEALERRRDAALRALPGLLDAVSAATEAVAEAERLLREDQR